jgi:flagella basal body P-ring formation protein FlgA
MNKIVWIISGWLIFVAPVVAAGDQPEQRGSIRLRHDAVGERDVICLKDVADVSAGSAELRQKLEDLVIARTKDGEKAPITVGYFEIRKAMAEAEISTNQIDIYGSMCCRVGSASDVKPDDKAGQGDSEKAVPETTGLIQAAGDIQSPAAVDESVVTLEKALKQTLNQLSGLEGQQLAISWRCEPTDILQQPASKYSIKPRGVMGLGKVCFEVRESGTGDRKAENSVRAGVTRVYGNVELICESVVAARLLQPGEVIGENDVAMMIRRVDSFRETGINDKASVVGREAAVPITEQRVILPTMIKKYMVIKRNDAVEIVSRVGPVHVTMPGISRDAGGFGDVITVRSEQNKSLLRVRVLDAGKVEVIGQDPASPPMAAVSKADHEKIN